MRNSSGAGAAYFGRFAEICFGPSAALAVAAADAPTVGDVVGALGRMVEALSALTPPLEAASAHTRLIQAVSEERGLLEHRGTAQSSATLGLDLTDDSRLVEVLKRAEAAFAELVEVAARNGVRVSIPDSEPGFGWIR